MSGAIFTQNSTTRTSGTVTVKFNAPSAGTYTILVKFGTKDIIDQATPNLSTVGYTYSTGGVTGSAHSLNLTKNH